MNKLNTLYTLISLGEFMCLVIVTKNLRLQAGDLGHKSRKTLVLVMSLFTVRVATFPPETSDLRDPNSRSKNE